MWVAVLAWLFIIGLVVLVLVAARGQTASQNAFFAELNSLGVRGEGVKRVLLAGSHEVRTDYSAGSKNSPSRFTLTTSVQAPGAFTVEREGSADKFFEGLGLEGKIASNDPDFDAKYHVVSDDDEFAAAYFSSADKRRAVAALFGLGCKAVELDGGGLKATWSPFKLGGASASFVKDALPLLAALAESLPQGLPFRLEHGVSRKFFNGLFVGGLILMYAGFIALPLAARAKSFFPLNGTEVFLASLRWSGAAFAVFMLGAIALLKGKSWFMKGFFQALFSGLLVFPLFGYWGLVWANCAWDPSPAAAHQTPVDSKYWTSGKHGNDYHVRVRSWRPGHGSESLSVSRGAYDRITPGRTLALVTTKPGYLGHEWILQYRFLEAPAPAGLSGPR